MWCMQKTLQINDFKMSLSNNAVGVKDICKRWCTFQNLQIVLLPGEEDLESAVIIVAVTQQR